MPGYVDLQVNGYAGIDFNAMRSDRATIWSRPVSGSADDGTETFLATIITAPVDEMVAKIARLASWLDQVPRDRASHRGDSCGRTFHQSG